MVIRIYTDGATSRNGQEGAVGGWAYLAIIENKMENFSNFEYDTTNQRMELTAAVKALTRLQHLFGYGTKVELYSDSAYLVNCWKDGWWKNWEKNGWLNSKGEPVANQDLWELLIPFFKEKRIEFIKVKGHSGDEFNEIVDKLAVNETRKARMFLERGYK